MGAVHGPHGQIQHRSAADPHLILRTFALNPPRRNQASRIPSLGVGDASNGLNSFFVCLVCAGPWRPLCVSLLLDRVRSRVYDCCEPTDLVAPVALLATTAITGSRTIRLLSTSSCHPGIPRQRTNQA